MTMTVGKLKKVLADLPDDTPVVRSGSDHTYLKLHRLTLRWAGTANDDDSYLGESYDESDVGTLFDGRVRVLLVE